jgi:hypothetical protein
MSNDAGVRRAALAFAGCALLLALAPAAGAQGNGTGRERAGVIVGALLTNRDTDTRLDSDNGPGTDIDLEDDLGLKSSLSVGRFGDYVWIKPRQRFDLAYFDLSRSATKRIDKTIVFGDQTFVIDTVLSTTADVTIVKADYTFAPLNRGRGYLGVTGGFTSPP